MAIGQDGPIPVFFHDDQLDFKPLYEWAFGEKVTHPETTARAESIVTAVQRGGARFDLRQPKEVPISSLRAQHDLNLLTLYRAAEAQLDADQTFYPMVFPREASADPNNLHHAGAFCFDSGTPLAAQTWRAATCSAACAVAAARTLRRESGGVTYALSRPPGHHATRSLFGGYCYLNNAALAARSLRRHGRVLIVDIDYHHGNGTQSLFWRDDKVYTVSVHADPRDAFPFFAGFPQETGAGRGAGHNLNVVLPQGIDGPAYFETFDAVVIPAVRTFAPDYLVVAAGFDGYCKDPVGHWQLVTADFEALGDRLGRLKLPTVVVQEGGYYTRHLGRNVVAFLDGVRAGQRAAAG